MKPAVVASSDSFGLDLLDLDPVSSAPAAPTPQVSQMQQQFNNASQNAFSNVGGGFDAFGGQTSGGFDAFGGQEVHAKSVSGFGAFGGQAQHPSPAPSNGFDAFGGQSSGGFDAFSSPQPQQQQQQQQQSGFGDFGGGFSPPKPVMPFIKVSAPSAEERAAEEAIMAAAVAKLPPKPKNFNAFDEISAPPPLHNGYGHQGGYPVARMPYGQNHGPGPVNPFDAQVSPINPFGAGGAPGYGGPTGNPFGGQMPPTPQFQNGFYPGMNQNGIPLQGIPQGLPPQGMPPPGVPQGIFPQGPGMPYGYPLGQPAPFGYSPQVPLQSQEYPPYGYPQQGPYHGQVGPGVPAYAARPAPPPEPVAPDPFSTVGGLGWGEVSKPTNYHPTVNTISAPYHPPSANNGSSSATHSSQSQSQPQPNNQFDSYVPPHPQQPPPVPPVDSGNPFDLF